jgi:hypothetical protein
MKRQLQTLLGGMFYNLLGMQLSGLVQAKSGHERKNLDISGSPHINLHVCPEAKYNFENDFKNEAKHSLQACLGQSI